MSDSAPSRSNAWWWLAATAIVLAGVGFMWLLWQGPWILDRARLGEGTTTGIASVVTGFRTAVVAVGAGIVAGTGLVLSHRSLQHIRTNDNRQAEFTRGTLELAHEGQVTDRFAKAISQLASLADVERLGGVYSLERIMRDSEKDHPTVVEVLAAFVRHHAPLPEQSGGQAGATPDQRLSEPVQAALTVLGRRPHRHEPFNIDLHRTDLRGADFNEANLANAQLWETDLRSANLFSADLRGANLFRTDLSEASLREAVITGAKTEQAFLRGSFLEGIEGLTAEQVVAAYPSSTTRLPDALADNQEVQERIVDLEMP
ncbi:pentapeptide repeat-containing protein [Streptomyces bottropensis]|uniref:pentapeptide repeat-containing protein n=1 Tax=Streptomyces bottropensis TaxID=42235 RepID=UPI0036AEA3B5